MTKHLVFLFACLLAVARLPAAGAEEMAATSAVATPAEIVKIDVLIGTGDEVVAGKPILVHYTGWIYDEAAPDHKGRKFDSSRIRDEPFALTLGEKKVIDGWEQGILGMKIGGRRTLIIPPSLGYGAQAVGKIPANSTLMFDIEALPPLPPLPVLTDIVSTDLVVGKGAEASTGMNVSLLTKGWVYSTATSSHHGKMFDDSRAGGTSLDFVAGAGRVLKGIDRAVIGMKVGGKREVIVPAHLGFGGRRVGIMVPENSVLIYELELINARQPK